MGTHHPGTPEETKALNAFITLMRAADTLTSRLGEGLAENELTTSQFGILETLFHLGPLCQKELAKKLLVTGANVTMVADNLEKRGLVSRARNTDDRRLVTVSLTPSGRRLISTVFPKHMGTIVKLFAVLSPADQETLRRLCRALGTQNKPKRSSHD